MKNQKVILVLVLLIVGISMITITGGHVCNLFAYTSALPANDPSESKIDSYGEPRDLRKLLYDDYVKTNSTDLEGKKIVRFAHIGDIEVDGSIYHVVGLRTVLKGMLAPRGNHRILLYGSNLKFLEAVPYSLTTPLWCEDSRVYLWGAAYLEGMSGNVWEFKDGIEEGERKLIEIPEYGSYKSEETLEIEQQD